MRRIKRDVLFRIEDDTTERYLGRRSRKVALNMSYSTSPEAPHFNLSPRLIRKVDVQGMLKLHYSGIVTYIRVEFFGQILNSYTDMSIYMFFHCRPQRCK